MHGGVLALLSGLGLVVGGLASPSGPAAAAAGSAPPPDPRYYDIGSPLVTDLWVDPANGSDSNSGATRADALQTLGAAWSQIPAGVSLTSGYRVKLVAGTYSTVSVPGYWASRFGTFTAPIIVEAADGQGTAVLPGLTIAGCRYLYLVGVRLESDSGDVLDCDHCDHVLLRQVTLAGADPSTYAVPETLRVSQSQNIYVEDSDVSGAWDAAVNLTAVQYGHLQGNHIHDAGGWCANAKGGSASLRVEGNEFFDCAGGGFTAGQDTGLEFLVSPWLHYETYDIKVINNVVHDANGAGIGVNGGYNVLVAHNTLFRVGAASHGLDFAFGQRGCDGDMAACATQLVAGGWGTAAVGTDVPIPNRNVYVYNNILYNPLGYASQWQQFVVPGPRLPLPGSNIPSPASADANLQIRGNVIWNGPPDLPLGIEAADQGCQPDNPTCNASQLLAENAINSLEPQLADPELGDFRPDPGSNVYTAAVFAIPDFAGGDTPAPPAVPAGTLSNAVPFDLLGALRAGPNPPGAFVGATTCGNGAIDAGEQCDDANLIDGDGCDSNCTLTACGNGIVTNGEQCDDGNSDSSDACKNDCTSNICGDGALFEGVEECDDGNTVPADGCSSTCKSELIPGGGPARTDCESEWLVVPVPSRTRSGIPRNLIVCTEDDPTCDAGAHQDNACTFRVALCFNVDEQRLQCTPSDSDVAGVHLSSPRQEQPRDATDAANRDAIEAALSGMNGLVRGQCRNRGATLGAFCGSDADCDSSLGSGDGVCKGRSVIFNPPLATTGCSQMALITVPLRASAGSFAAGVKILKLTATPSNDPVTGKRRQTDGDTLKLVCKPHS